MGIACQYGISLNKEEIEFPMIIHQKISKHIARQKFGIEDEAILSAIECHTTLKKNYSKLDLVLFIADKIMWDQEGEPPYLAGLLGELEYSLERAAFYYINYLLNNNIKVVHPWLRDAYKQLNCSGLIGQAYKKSVNIDLDSNGGLAVYPSNIRDSKYTVTYKSL